MMEQEPGWQTTVLQLCQKISKAKGVENIELQL